MDEVWARTLAMVRQCGTPRAAQPVGPSRKRTLRSTVKAQEGRKMRLHPQRYRLGALAFALVLVSSVIGIAAPEEAAASVGCRNCIYTKSAKCTVSSGIRDLVSWKVVLYNKTQFYMNREGRVHMLYAQYHTTFYVAGFGSNKVVYPKNFLLMFKNHKPYENAIASGSNNTRAVVRWAPHHGVTARGLTSLVYSWDTSTRTGCTAMVTSNP
jgi:hypothetical protein